VEFGTNPGSRGDGREMTNCPTFFGPSFNPVCPSWEVAHSIPCAMPACQFEKQKDATRGSETPQVGDALLAVSVGTAFGG
jgi:hypothetical protein